MKVGRGVSERHRPLADRKLHVSAERLPAALLGRERLDVQRERLVELRGILRGVKARNALERRNPQAPVRRLRNFRQLGARPEVPSGGKKGDHDDVSALPVQHGGRVVVPKAVERLPTAQPEEALCVEHHCREMIGRKPMPGRQRANRRAPQTDEPAARCGRPERSIRRVEEVADRLPVQCGVYFARLMAPGGTRTLRLVVVN